MTRKKWFRILCGFLLVAGVGILLLSSRYVCIDGRLYHRNPSFLDLRGQTVSLSHYEALSQAMPDTEIRWDVPFQGTILADDAEALTIVNLSEEDTRLLADYLPGLRVLHAEQCTDYPNLLWLKQQRPEIQIFSEISVNGTAYSGSTVSMTLNGLTEAELKLLPLLPLLKTVTVTGGDPEILPQLQQYCAENSIAFYIRIGEDTLPQDTQSLQLHGITDKTLPLLYCLPNLKTLHLTEPEADANNLLALVDALPGTAVTWEKTILGLTFSQDAVEIDLTDVIALGDGETLGDKTAYQYGLAHPILGTEEEVRSAIKILEYHPLPDKTERTRELIAEAEAAMAYFPKAEKLVMCGSILDNEAMSAFREAKRDSYKVVWSVKCGNIAPRTDATFFMPTKYHVYYFFTADAYNLKYCEDVECIDLGHMIVMDISFVEYMPKLKYLILTLGKINDISPLSTCKNLVFLEMDWTSVKDYSPLLGCTALEDLNIGETFGDITPICQMTWLKNLWVVGCGHDVYRAVTEALPDTHIGAFYDNPDDGWRQLPNYFKMRDALLMFYML